MVANGTLPGVPDSSKAANELDYEVVPIRAMVEESVEWMHTENLIAVDPG